MYLTELYLQNTGAISECRVTPPFENGNPQPIVIVGPNGSGKTIFFPTSLMPLLNSRNQPSKT